MSNKMKLAGKLPGDEPVNGLDRLAENLCTRWDDGDPDNPAAVLIVGIAKVRSYQVVRDDDGVRHVPTMEITRIEALGVLGTDPMDRLDLAPVTDQQRLLDVAEDRIGATPLPIDAESGLDNHTVLED